MRTELVLAALVVLSACGQTTTVIGGKTADAGVDAGSGGGSSGGTVGGAGGGLAGGRTGGGTVGGGTVGGGTVGGGSVGGGSVGGGTVGGGTVGGGTVGGGSVGGGSVGGGTVGGGSVGGGSVGGGSMAGGASGGSAAGGSVGGGSAGGSLGGGSSSGGTAGGGSAGGSVAGGRAGGTSGGASSGGSTAGGAAGGTTAGGTSGGGSAGGGTAGGTSGGGSAGGASSGGTAALPTEIVVVLVGDGSAALTTGATAVTLQRRLISTGILVSSLPMPIAASGANQPFTLGGTASADGSLTLSTNRRTLALAGYAATPGTASVQTTTSARIVGLVNAAAFTGGAIDTSTVLTTLFPNNPPRTAVSDGTNVWVAGGSGGIFRTTVGSTSTPINIATAPSTGRVLGIFGGNLFLSTGSPPTGVLQVGTGLPLVSTTTTSVVAVGSPYGLAFFDVSTEPGDDLLYVADESAGLLRFVKSGGTWAQSATFTPAVRHLACFLDGADVVCLATSSSTLLKLRDVGHALASGGMSSLGTASTNTAFRGLAFMPLP